MKNGMHIMYFAINIYLLTTGAVVLHYLEETSRVQTKVTQSLSLHKLKKCQVYPHN